MGIAGMYQGYLLLKTNDSLNYFRSITPLDFGLTIYSDHVPLLKLTSNPHFCKVKYSINNSILNRIELKIYLINIFIVKLYSKTVRCMKL